ncbi:g1917 [Coccomyxa elongata]
MSPPVLPTGEPKTSAQRFLSKARRLLEPKAEQPESAESCGTGVGAGSGGAEKASMVDPLKLLKEVQKELAAEKDRARGTKEGLAATQAELAGTQAELTGTQAELAGTQAELAGTRAQLADTQAQLARTQAQVAETKAQVAATEARADQVLAEFAYQQAQIEGTHAQAQGICAQAQGIEAKVAAYQLQLAATLQVAQKAQADAAMLRSFAEDAAKCQVQALLECYQILYYKEANNFRQGQPQNFTEAKHSWNDYVSRASPEEELHMVSKGFTRAATDAAKKGLDSFQDKLTAAIHKLDRGLITHFFSLRNLTGDPGLEQALAVVDAHSASQSI